ncbi:uncharacterized protein LOC129317510 [Prosopis cineraria]|uniref:uncharacterized protein LOC129317510 n=1 Tax=Prosopis cineraria TaxID=364024 RepID=UPI00240ED457|nr:uncharacterized protein LOC129317510 [Prosopis cineraria]
MLPQLSTLTISDSSQVEEIFKFSNIEDHDIDSEREIVFPNLKHITLEKLPRLVNVCQGFKMHPGEFIRVDVYECPKFTSIMRATIDWNGKLQVPQASIENSDFQTATDVEGQLSINEEKGMILTSRVERMSLKDSGSLMSLWEGPILISFQTLKDLYVNGCKKLKCIFPGTVIKSLPCLWKLKWLFPSLPSRQCYQVEGLFKCEVEIQEEK